jgi:hypothetical protein
MSASGFVFGYDAVNEITVDCIVDAVVDPVSTVVVAFDCDEY